MAELNIQCLDGFDPTKLTGVVGEAFAAMRKNLKYSSSLKAMKTPLIAIAFEKDGMPCFGIGFGTWDRTDYEEQKKFSRVDAIVYHAFGKFGLSYSSGQGVRGGDGSISYAYHFITTDQTLSAWTDSGQKALNPLHKKISNRFERALDRSRSALTPTAPARGLEAVG